MAHTRQTLTYTNITALEWSPLYIQKRKGEGDSHLLFKERFIISLSDGNSFINILF